MLERRLTATCLALCAGVASALVGSAFAAPSAFRLSFDGRHTPATFPTQFGLKHEGPFTATGPFCTSGNAVDLRHETRPLAAVRRFTCANGDSITLRVVDFPSEHELGAHGDWKIIDGSGQYATLRGKGTWTSVSVSGDQADPATVTFRTTSEGIADFDAVAPAITISQASLRKLGGTPRTFLLRVAFSARDDVAENAVSYKLTIRAGSQLLATRTGQTAKPVSASMRVHASKVVVTVVVTDPLGNERTVTRALRLAR
jgi:hypothetical protein